MAYRFKHGDRPLDDYTIQRAVGSGGFGEVYYAVSDGGREVALKYLRENPQAELRGVSHCINLKSPHLVSIFDVKKNADEDYFIIMEYCSGPSLRDLLIAEPNGFPKEKAVFFVREIAKGLAYLHDRGIVHRDLKPGNLFYDDGYVKIGDYGLSKFIAVSRHSAQTASVGTVHYMAPEIGSGDYSRSVDIYALGVMFYEMLLGKVPFEGSSMAEILMKHLTSQPEVEALPEPFSKVIRKALEKDPKDRYQTVDELVDDLLSVEDVQKSLAGFSTQSLEGAVRRGAYEKAKSPVPSPNPRPRKAYRAQVPSLDLRAGVDSLPKGAAKRLERVQRRVEQRVAKLGGGPARRIATPGRYEHRGQMQEQAAGTGRARKALPAALLTVGLAIGLGVVFGNKLNDDEVGVGVGLTVMTMSAGVALSRRAGGWIGAEAGPRWADAVVRVCLCAPAAFLGMVPLLDTGRWEDVGLAVACALTAVALLADWSRAIQEGAQGELSISRALWVGFGAAIMGAMFGGIFDARDPSHSLFMAGAITAASSLVVQANAWWLVGDRRRRIPIIIPGETDGPAGKASGARDAHADGDAGQAQAEHAGAEDAGNIPYAVPVAGGQAQVSGPRWGDSAWTYPQPKQRSWFTRAFWSLAAFLFMGASVFSFVLQLVSDELKPDDVTAAILVCIGGGAMLIFALRKTTMFKRDGLWRDTIRPFLICALMFAIGGTITGITRHWDDRWVGDEGRVVLITGLVLASVAFLYTLAFTGRRRRIPLHSFVNASAGQMHAADGSGRNVAQRDPARAAATDGDA